MFMRDLAHTRARLTPCAALPDGCDTGTMLSLIDGMLGVMLNHMDGEHGVNGVGPAVRGAMLCVEDAQLRLLAAGEVGDKAQQ